MKKFKQADLSINLFLIVSLTLWSLIRLDDTFIYSYFIAGGWQVISMLVHAMNGWFTEKGSARRVYHWITFVTVLLGCLVPVLPFLFPFLFILLFTAPLMAVYYFFLCLGEVKRMHSRPLSLLK